MIVQLKKLIKVKSIVTLLVTGVFCYLAVTGKVSGEQFMTIFATIIAFYYGTQAGKDESTPAAKKQDTKGDTEE